MDLVSAKDAPLSAVRVTEVFSAAAAAGFSPDRRGSVAVATGLFFDGEGAAAEPIPIARMRERPRIVNGPKKAWCFSGPSAKAGT